MSGSGWLAIIVIVIAAIGAALIAGVVAPRIRHARNSIWQRFARRHGLGVRTAKDDEPIIEGLAHGRRLTIRRTDSGADGDLIGMANVRIELVPRNPPASGLTVVNAGAPVGRVAHLIDDHVADPGLLHAADPGFHMLVQESDAAAGSASSYLTADRRSALQSLADQAGRATVGLEAGKLFWEDRDFASDLDQLEHRFGLLEQAAAQLEASPSSPVDPAVAAALPGS